MRGKRLNATRGMGSWALAACAWGLPIAQLFIMLCFHIISSILHWGGKQTAWWLRHMLLGYVPSNKTNTGVPQPEQHDGRRDVPKAHSSSQPRSQCVRGRGESRWLSPAGRRCPVLPLPRGSQHTALLPAHSQLERFG